jgi:hypothetical protein
MAMSYSKRSSKKAVSGNPDDETCTPEASTRFLVHVVLGKENLIAGDSVPEFLCDLVSQLRVGAAYPLIHPLFNATVLASVNVQAARHLAFFDPLRFPNFSQSIHVSSPSAVLHTAIIHETYNRLVVL